MKYNKLYENWNKHLEEEEKPMFDPETGENINYDEKGNRIMPGSPEEKKYEKDMEARQAKYNAMSPEEKAELMKTRAPGQDKATENPAGDTRWAQDYEAKGGEGKKLKAVAKELKVLLSKIMQELEE